MKRAIWTGFAVVAIAAVAAGIYEARASEPDVNVPVQCGGGVCVVPQAFLMELVKVHNEQVDEIKRLEKDCTKPKLKTERNT